jgi:hypothetical protein
MPRVKGLSDGFFWAGRLCWITVCIHEWSKGFQIFHGPRSWLCPYLLEWLHGSDVRRLLPCVDPLRGNWCLSLQSFPSNSLWVWGVNSRSVRYLPCWATMSRRIQHWWWGSLTRAPRDLPSYPPLPLGDTLIVCPKAKYGPCASIKPIFGEL